MLYSCAYVNQGGQNHNHYTQRLVILHWDLDVPRPPPPSQFAADISLCHFVSQPVKPHALLVQFLVPNCVYNVPGYSATYTANS